MWQFEFKDWRDAFEMYYRKKKGMTILRPDGSVIGKTSGNPDICLVISTEPYSSGYWIEENARSDENTFVYKSVKAVEALEQRIIKTKQESGGLALKEFVL